MFSQDALIQFVFTNERTSVFWNGIFRTKLDHYLFYKLCKDDFKLTYFVESTGGKLSVYHYAGSDAESFGTIPFFGSQENQLAKWILKQFTKKKRRCAVVVPLDAFCRLFEKEEKVLSALAEKHQKGECFGTIVLVGSHNADKNQPYLMGSPVFDYLQEDAVLQLRSTQKIERIYSMLSSFRQRQNCFFLNRYTRKGITDLVSYMAVRSAKCYPGAEKLHAAANYLTRYLNSPAMQMSENRLFDRNFPFICPSYQEMDKQLRKKDIWTALLRQSEAYAQANPEDLRDEAVDKACQAAQFIYHDNSIQMKCMKLCVPGALSDNLYDNRTIEKLNQIYGLVRQPGNGTVNQMIAAQLDEFILLFQSARQAADKDTCFRIAAGLLLGVNWLTVEDEKEVLVLEIIRMTKDCVKASSDLFELQKLNTGLITSQQKEAIYKLKTSLQHFDATFSALNMNVVLSITDVMQNMQYVRRQLPLITADDYAIPDDPFEEERSLKKKNTVSNGGTSSPPPSDVINMFDED